MAVFTATAVLCRAKPGSLWQACSMASACTVWGMIALRYPHEEVIWVRNYSYSHLHLRLILWASLQVRQTRLALVGMSNQHRVIQAASCWHCRCQSLPACILLETSIDFYHYWLLGPLRSCTALARSVLP